LSLRSSSTHASLVPPPFPQPILKASKGLRRHTLRVSQPTRTYNPGDGARCCQWQRCRASVGPVAAGERSKLTRMCASEMAASGLQPAAEREQRKADAAEDRRAAAAGGHAVHCQSRVRARVLQELPASAGGQNQSKWIGWPSG
jgi:hypothetical protein